jgi:hypothetical protein
MVIILGIINSVGPTYDEFSVTTVESEEPIWNVDINSIEDLNRTFIADYTEYLSIPLTKSDVLPLVDRLITFRRLRNIKEVESLYFQPYHHEFYANLENKLFPWMKIANKIDALEASFVHHRGIVIPTGNQLFSVAVTLIKILRHLGCHLPIEIFYLGSRDLSEDRRNYLETFKDISCIDITMSIDIAHPDLVLKGWFIKPFAMLFSSFQEIILIDADVVFLQNPEIFFQTIQYRNTGALFFYDRQLINDHNKPKEYATILKQIVPKPYPASFTSRRIIQELTEYEMDSGVVIIDKRRHFYGLLMICLLNTLPIRSSIQSISYGDKESFWIGFDMLKESYSFIDEYAGTIGNPEYGNHTAKHDHILCGAMAHFDDVLELPGSHPTPPLTGNRPNTGNLLWFQDSLLFNKRDINEHEKMVYYTHLNHDNHWAPSPRYSFHNKQCAQGEKIPLPEHDMALIELFKSFYMKDHFEKYEKQEFQRPMRLRH